MGKLGFLTLALILMTSPANAQTPDDRFLIVPGERIGRVKLGMTLDEVKSILGAPHSSKKLLPREADTDYEWPSNDGTHDGRLEVLVDEDYGVIKIGVRLDTRYATSEGVRAGSSLVEIMRGFGPKQPASVPDAPNVSLVYENGITFVLPKPLTAAHVEEIIVTYRQNKEPPPAASCSLKDRTKEGCLWLNWINLGRQGATLVIDGRDVCRAPETRGLPSVEGTMCSAPVSAGPHHYSIRRDDGEWCDQDKEVNVAAGRDTIVSCLSFGPR